jgi:hypothetical protein
MSQPTRNPSCSAPRALTELATTAARAGDVDRARRFLTLAIRVETSAAMIKVVGGPNTTAEYRY